MAKSIFLLILILSEETVLFPFVGVSVSGGINQYFGESFRMLSSDGNFTVGSKPSLSDSFFYNRRCLDTYISIVIFLRLYETTLIPYMIRKGYIGASF
jgi:hypothetical protein